MGLFGMVFAAMVSRRHAVIHREEDDHCWIADYGSCNGAFVNARRITQPTTLSHGDLISVGSCVLTFFDERPEMPHRHGGAMNTLLGDGYFAYWQESPDSANQVNDFLTEFRGLQDRAAPEFLRVLHHGPVIHSGGAAYEGCLSGIEVHVAFRLEKLAGELQQPRLMSEAAMRLLAMKREAWEVGQYELKGFEGAYPVFGFRGRKLRNTRKTRKEDVVMYSESRR